MIHASMQTKLQSLKQPQHQGHAGVERERRGGAYGLVIGSFLGLVHLGKKTSVAQLVNAKQSVALT